MKIIIVGGGKVGKNIIKYLIAEGHNIIVIDKNPEVLANIINIYDVGGICGSGVINGVLQDADVQNSDLVIALTSHDEDNILCCLLAKKLGAKNTIARVREPEFAEDIEFYRDVMGINVLINPEKETAKYISRLLRFPSAMTVDTFARGKVDSVEIKINANSELANLLVKDLYEKYKIQIILCCIRRGEDVFIPNGETELLEGDNIYIMATPTNLDLFFKKAEIFNDKVRSVIIIGGGRITYYLAKYLAETGIKTKIIEIDKNKCIDLTKQLGKSTIVCGDGTDKLVLEEQGIESVDAFVALTGIDEENIMSSLFAKSKGVDKAIPKVNSETFEDILEKIELHDIVSPKEITISHILKQTRAWKEKAEDGIITLYKMFDEKAEAVELFVGKNDRLINKSLREISFENAIVGCIIKDQGIIIPNGDSVISEGDRIVIVTITKSITQIDDVLKK